MGPVALLIATGVLVGTVALTAAGGDLADPQTGTVDARTGLAVATATAALVGIVWLLLWRAVADRPAPWKPAVFAGCLVLFLIAPAIAVLQGGSVSYDDAPARLAWAISSVAIAAGAAVPYIDAALTRASSLPAPLRKRL